MEIIISILGFCITIVTVFLTSYLSKRNQLNFEKQKLKQTYYINYIDAYNLHINNPTNETIKSLCNAHNNLFLIGSINVINKLQYFDELLANNGKIAKEKYNLIMGTPEHSEECHKRFSQFIKAMRSDLYKEKEVNYFPIIILKSYNYKTPKLN